MLDPQERFTNSKRGSASYGVGTPGSYLAKVTRVTGGIFVTCPKVAPGKTFGPCQVFASTLPTKGKTVLVTFLNNKFEEAVIIGIKHA
jgi:hypothetical protein